MLARSIPCHDHLQEPACPRGVRWSGGAGWRSHVGDRPAHVAFSREEPSVREPGVELGISESGLEGGEGLCGCRHQKPPGL